MFPVTMTDCMRAYMDEMRCVRMGEVEGEFQILA